MKIKYLCKGKNNKFFRVINMYPLELVRHVEGECQALFSAKTTTIAEIQPLYLIASQAVCLQNICTVDNLWTHTSQYSGCGWV